MGLLLCSDSPGTTSNFQGCRWGASCRSSPLCQTLTSSEQQRHKETQTHEGKMEEGDLQTDLQVAASQRNCSHDLFNRDMKRSSVQDGTVSFKRTS